ncbi:2-hydroxyacid dehydrogenase [Arthrobacter tumbae]|uniref:2-hydroxyacid dehydrogenase n=1 Tax=Arthrobacter tumbae TaxID=163874 RepID=UPI00195B865C|nr:D-glycerate dehydrogenase [Arthrobacter tumbae]MBM7781940.1 lactate dehydrogenase-like 2-hydroxyacid dehydrogenase [Arthrobacter tumbae]
MANGHLYVTRDLGPEPMQILRESGHEVVVHPDRDLPPTREELLEHVNGAVGIITLLTEAMDAELFDRAGPQLKVVAAVSVGTDNIDVHAAESRGITVTNTPDVLTDATADLAIGLLLALNRRIVEADAFLRRSEPWSWGPRLFLGRDLAGETLGIVGYGRIGEALATRARAFGMRVIAAASGSGSRGGVERMPLDELLATADVISLHAPLNGETRHLIGARQIASMKPGAVIINTARGPLIDEDALVDALRNRRIRGAGLDVFEHEPAIHPGLLELDNVVLTPHIGSAGEQTRTRMALLAIKNALAVLDHSGPLTPVSTLGSTGSRRDAVTVPSAGVGKQGES